MVGLIEQRIMQESYLKLLVNEIRVKGNQAEISGSYSALANAVAEMKMGTLGRVPIFVPNWLASSDQSGHWCIQVPIV